MPDHRALDLGLLYLAGWVLCALLAAAVGGARGRGGAGFVLGAVFGPGGILLALFLPSAHRRARRRRR